jgi:CheY-like chemotaxis protein
VHPDPAQLEMLSAVIAGMGYEAIPTSKPEEALKLVERGQCRLVLVDVHMPEMDGYDFLDRALRSDPGVHVILMTGDYTLDSALEGIRRGASDFLPNPIDYTHLKRSLDEVAALYDQRRRVRALEEQLLKDLEFHGIVGKARRCWKYLILRGRSHGTTPTCCWRDRREREKSPQVEVTDSAGNKYTFSGVQHLHQYYYRGGGGRGGGGAACHYGDLGNGLFTLAREVQSGR